MELMFIIGFVFLTTVLWLWAVTDIIKSTFKRPIITTIWLLVVLVFPIVGSIVYFQTRRSLTKKGKRKFQPDFNRAG